MERTSHFNRTSLGVLLPLLVCLSFTGCRSRETRQEFAGAESARVSTEDGRAEGMISLIDKKPDSEDLSQQSTSHLPDPESVDIINAELADASPLEREVLISWRFDSPAVVSERIREWKAGKALAPSPQEFPSSEQLADHASNTTPEETSTLDDSSIAIRSKQSEWATHSENSLAEDSPVQPVANRQETPTQRSDFPVIQSSSGTAPSTGRKELSDVPVRSQPSDNPAFPPDEPTQPVLDVFPPVEAGPETPSFIQSHYRQHSHSRADFQPTSFRADAELNDQSEQSRAQIISVQNAIPDESQSESPNATEPESVVPSTVQITPQSEDQTESVTPSVSTSQISSEEEAFPDRSGFDPFVTMTNQRPKSTVDGPPIANSVPINPGDQLPPGQFPLPTPQTVQSVVPENGTSVSPNSPMTTDNGTTNSSAADLPMWQSDLKALLPEMEKEVTELSIGTTEAEWAEYVRQHVNLRLGYLLAGESEKAMQPIPQVSATDQEFWQQLFLGMSSYLEVEQGLPRDERASLAVSQFQTAIRKLQESAKLRIQNVNFCLNILGFGNYEKFQKDEFSRGQPVLLYAELQNVKNELAPNGQFYETSLRAIAEIWTTGANPQAVERIILPHVRDHSRAIRQDYFHSYELTIPARLPLGRYVLKLSVQDLLSKKTAIYSVGFVVN